MAVSLSPPAITADGTTTSTATATVTDSGANPVSGDTVEFTSDGGQHSTGDPFVFGARVLDGLAREIGEGRATELGVANPAAIVSRLGIAAAA